MKVKEIFKINGEEKGLHYKKAPDLRTTYDKN